MYFQIRLHLACFLIVAYSTIYFQHKMRLHTLTSKNFACGLTSTLLHSLLAIAVEYALANRAVMPAWVVELLVELFYTTLLVFYMLVLHYVYLYFERGTLTVMRRGKQVLLAVWMTALACQWLLPVTYVESPAGVYCAGAKVLVTQAFQVYTLGMILWLLARYRQVVVKAKDWILFGSPAMFATLTIAQFCFPQAGLTSLALTMVVLGTMVSAEDAHVYTDFSTGMYNDRGVRELIQELLLANVPFQLGVYVFVGTDADVLYAMRAIEAALPRARGGYVCCTPMDDMLVVLPTRTFSGVNALPQPLPKPSFGDGLKYQIHTLRMEPGDKARELRLKVAALKEQFVDSQLMRDEVTGLMRRAVFTRRAELLLSQPEPFAFLMLDLDDFKGINDVYGHQVGDQVLKSVADAMASELRSTDLLCRIGGDEFAAALPGVTERKRLQELLDNVQLRLDAQSMLPDDKRRVCVSVGAKLYEDGHPPIAFEDAYDAADGAMYRAKHSGKGKLYVCA